MTNPVVEEASVEHLDELYRIEKKCFAEEAFAKKQIAYLLADRESVNLVVKSDGNVVGFIMGRVYFDQKARTGHILTIDVSPEYRRKGLGFGLMQEVEKIFNERGVETCCLEVRGDNAAALSLYKKCGYREFTTLPGYYGDVHGIALRKALTQLP